MKKIPGVTAAHPFGDKGRIQVEISEKGALEKSAVEAAFKDTKFTLRKMKRIS